MSKPPTLTQRVVSLEAIAEDNRVCIGELADALLGTRKGRLDDRRQEDGITHRVIRIEEMLSNGGVKVRWGTSKWVAVGSAMVAAVADIVIRLT